MYLGSDADNSPLDVAYDSVNEITLSRGADTLVQKLRRAWIFLLATPIAWAHGQPHAQAMRRNKLRKIADGTRHRGTYNTLFVEMAALQSTWDGPQRVQVPKNLKVNNLHLSSLGPGTAPKG